MFDIAPAELMVVAIVALLVIGPKDLPKAMRFVGQWMGKARGVARQFRSGFDSMVREAELAEMEKKWAEENARIMREFPTGSPGPTPALEAPKPGEPALVDTTPATVEQPVIRDADPEAASAAPASAPDQPEPGKPAA